MPTPLTGQVNVSGSAQPLSTTSVNTAAFTVKAPLTNKLPIYIGAASVTTGNGYQLDPGDSFDYERLIQNGQPSYQLQPSDFFVVGTAPDKATWLASPA